MQRYFGEIKNNHVILSKDDIFHIKKVMRARVNDEIEVVSSSKTYLVKIASLEPIEFEIIKEIIEDNEIANHLILAFAPLKGDHFDLVLQKATELGVKEIIVLNTSRTVKAINKEQFENKKDRYEKILKEASEQSKRSLIPSIRYLDFKDLNQIDADIKMIAYEEVKGNTSSFIDIINTIKPNDQVVILIGPEGGFSVEEVNFANSLNYKCVSLGKRILRAETASFYALSVLGAFLER